MIGKGMYHGSEGNLWGLKILVDGGDTRRSMSMTSDAASLHIALLMSFESNATSFQQNKVPAACSHFGPRLTMGKTAFKQMPIVRVSNDAANIM